VKVRFLAERELRGPMPDLLYEELMLLQPVVAVTAQLRTRIGAPVRQYLYYKYGPHLAPGALI
jgi:hypothetical protein